MNSFLTSAGANLIRVEYIEIVTMLAFFLLKLIVSRFEIVFPKLIPRTFSVYCDYFYQMRKRSSDTL